MTYDPTRDPGVSDMCRELVAYCDTARTTQEIMAKAMSLSDKVDIDIASGLLSRIVGCQWVAYTGPEHRELKATAKGALWVKEGH